MDREQLLNDTETATRIALDGRQAQMWTALPAIVQSVDLAAMTVEAQPAIQGVITNPDGTEQNVNLPLLVDCPLCFPSAGGFTLTLPIKAGDEVLIVIASRCIDTWWQNGGVGVPAEARMHDLSDGFALPGPRSQPRALPAISATNAQLRNDAGSVYLEITPSGAINMKATAGVSITGGLVVDGLSFATHVHDVTTAPGVTGVGHA
jgi:Phage protein Gp138 N-terminal domain